MGTWPGEWDKYCQFYGIDTDRERFDMPCDSWRFKRHADSMKIIQIVYWYNQLERGELTRRSITASDGLRRAAGGGRSAVQRRVVGVPALAGDAAACPVGKVGPAM